MLEAGVDAMPTLMTKVGVGSRSGCAANSWELKCRCGRSNPSRGTEVQVWFPKATPVVGDLVACTIPESQNVLVHANVNLMVN